MGMFKKSAKKNKPYTFDEMSFYDDIIYDEEGIGLGYDDNPAMDTVKKKEKANRQVKEHKTSRDYSEPVIMNGYQYEEACAEYLRNNGYTDVKVTGASADQGIDVIAVKDGKKYGIQCKYYSSSVGNKAVQEAFSGAAYYGCDCAVVMTNSKFTQSAKELAHRNDVFLWSYMNPKAAPKKPAEPYFYPGTSLPQKIVSVALTIIGIIGTIFSLIVFIFMLISGDIGLKDLDFFGFVVGTFFNMFNPWSKICDNISIAGYTFALIVSTAYGLSLGNFTLFSEGLFYVPLLLTLLHLYLYKRDERKRD